MNKSDFQVFYKEWVNAHEISSSNKTPSQTAVTTVFEILGQYNLESVIGALRVHNARSRFSPTPHDIIEIIGIYNKLNVECPSHAEIIALAQNPTTPLGVLARIQIGSFDLNNQDSFYLRQRAGEVILKFDEYMDKCESFGYTEHELSTMAKYKVDPTMPLAKGLPSPNENSLKRLSNE